MNNKTNIFNEFLTNKIVCLNVTCDLKAKNVDILSMMLVSGREAVCQVIGMYDYVAQNDDELAFQKGQVITVLNKDDCDWWKGELNGREGLFPSNYVKLTTDTDPSTQCEYSNIYSVCLTHSVY